MFSTWQWSYDLANDDSNLSPMAGERKHGDRQGIWKGREAGVETQRLRVGLRQPDGVSLRMWSLQWRVMVARSESLVGLGRTCVHVKHGILWSSTSSSNTGLEVVLQVPRTSNNGVNLISISEVQINGAVDQLFIQKQFFWQFQRKFST
jgi:hypothetical protein